MGERMIYESLHSSEIGPDRPWRVVNKEVFAKYGVTPDMRPDIEAVYREETRRR